MMVMESMDAGTETRRFSPLALVGGNYTDHMNRPMDHGMSSCPSMYVNVSLCACDHDYVPVV